MSQSRHIGVHAQMLDKMPQCAYTITMSKELIREGFPEMRTIPGFEGRYAITEDGVVYNLKTMRIVRRAIVDGHEYVRIRDSEGRKVSMRWEDLVGNLWVKGRPLYGDEVAFVGADGHVHVEKYLKALEEGASPRIDSRRQRTRIASHIDSIVRDWRNGMTPTDIARKYHTEKLKVYDIIREYRYTHENGLRTH